MDENDRPFGATTNMTDVYFAEFAGIQNQSRAVECGTCDLPGDQGSTGELDQSAYQERNAGCETQAQFRDD